MKFRVFWEVAPCSHVEVDRRFSFKVTTRRYVPEDSKLVFRSLPTFRKNQLQAYIAYSAGVHIPRVGLKSGKKSVI
jgi:hypothetical protein